MQHTGTPGSGLRTVGFPMAQAEPQLPSVLVSRTQMSSPERHESDVNMSEFVFLTHFDKGHALLHSEELELSWLVINEAAGEAVIR